VKIEDYIKKRKIFVSLWHHFTLFSVIISKKF
jgi:hypothetical protein